MRLVCFDIETTGLNAIYDRIVEIGAVLFDSEGAIIKEYKQLINPKKHITESVIEIHGITDEMVKDSPEIDVVLPEFFAFIEDYPLIAHNAFFDTSFISYAGSKHNKKIPSNPIYDSLALTRKTFKEIGSHSLGNLIRHFSLDIENQHRALEDAIATAKICNIAFRKLTKKRLTKKRLNKFLTPIYFADINWNLVENYEDLIEKIERHIADKGLVEIDYTDSKNNHTKRKVVPEGLFTRHGYVFLQGFCQLRYEERQFRLDRIRNIEFH